MHTKLPILIFCTLLISAKPTGFKSENKEITKTYVLVPAGPANNKDFYISSIEVTNKQYRAFITDLTAKGETEKLQKARVDTAKWRLIFKADPYTNYYSQNKAYDDYPVVNVSHEGALLYCAWLTEKYNRTAKVKVRFTLPDEEQWMRAAQGGTPQAVYPWKGNAITTQIKGKQLALCNYKHQQAPGGTNTNNTNADVTAPSISYIPNAYGIYNMSGNVAEMLSDVQFVKGGSWMSAQDKLTIQSKEENTAPSTGDPRVGFRPVMLLENKQ